MSDIIKVYLPSALLIGGAYAYVPRLLPLVVTLTALWGGINWVMKPGNGVKLVNGIEELVVKLTLTYDKALDKAKNEVKGVLDPSTFQEFPISKKTQTSHNTAIYRFKLPTDDSILGLPIGQHISLAATLDVKDPKTGEVTRKEVVRSYTPISSDVHPGYFDLLIKSYPQGNISRHMGTLDVGDKMKVRGPKGAMIYSPNLVRHLGMIAGGTGITPMLQIVNAVRRGRASGDRTKIDLIFANVDEKDILMREELDRLASEDKDINVYYVLNNPPEGWKGGVGFVTADMIKERLPAPATDIKILMCGPPPMISAIKKACESLGYDKARPVSKLDDQVFGF